MMATKTGRANSCCTFNLSSPGSPNSCDDEVGGFHARFREQLKIRAASVEKSRAAQHKGPPPILGAMSVTAAAPPREKRRKTRDELARSLRRNGIPRDP